MASDIINMTPVMVSKVVGRTAAVFQDE